MRVLVLAISVLAFLALGTLSYGWYGVSGYLGSPALGPGDPKVIEIPDGADLSTAVGVLRTQGLLPDSRWLDLYVDHLHEPKPIPPGEYAVSPTMTPVQQIQLLESGNVVTYTIAVEPGASADEIAEVLVGKRLADHKELDSLLYDPVYARSLGIDGPSLEGFLYPDIYDLPRRLSGRELLERFVRRFENATKEVDFAKMRERGYSRYQVVIIASLVEKADVKPEERRFFAALLYDRLKDNIALSSKPANAYGKARTAEGSPNPWDTTDRAGLPATPIASPSLDALRAAANPAPQHILYTAPRDDGTHVFCPDVDCYLEAFKKWKGRYPRGLPRRFPRR